MNWFALPRSNGIECAVVIEIKSKSGRPLEAKLNRIKRMRYGPNT